MLASLPVSPATSTWSAEAQLGAQPLEGAGLGRARREQVKVALAGVDDGDIQAGGGEALAQLGQLLRRRALEEPARFELVLEFVRLPAHAGKGARHRLELRQIPALGEEQGKVLEETVGAGVVNLGAHAADVVIGRRQPAVAETRRRSSTSRPLLKTSRGRRRAGSCSHAVLKRWVASGLPSRVPSRSLLKSRIGLRGGAGMAAGGTGAHSIAVIPRLVPVVVHERLRHGPLLDQGDQLLRDAGPREQAAGLVRAHARQAGRQALGCLSTLRW